MIAVKKQIWDSIREECTARGFNMTDLAALMHTSPTTVCRISKLDVMPRIDYLMALADEWGVSLDELTGRTEIPEATHPVKNKEWRKTRDARLAPKADRRSNGHC